MAHPLKQAVETARKRREEAPETSWPCEGCGEIMDLGEAVYEIETVRGAIVDEEDTMFAPDRPRASSSQLVCADCRKEVGKTLERRWHKVNGGSA